MRPRKMIIMAAVAAMFVLVLALLFVLRNKDDNDTYSINHDRKPHLANAGFAEVSASNEEAMHSASEREQAKIDAVVNQLKAMRNQSGNLSGFLEGLKADCPDEQACRALIETALNKLGDDKYADLIRRTLNRLPAYEQAMQSIVMSTSTPPQERYARIDALRQQILGKEETEFAFGQERTYAQFQFAYGDLLARAENLTSAQRLAELEKLRQSADKNITISHVDGRDGAYARELELLTVGIKDPTEKKRIAKEVRARYYSPEDAARLEKREEQVDTQTKQVQDYQAELTTLKREMEQIRSNMAENQWNKLYEERLTTLRLKHFPQ